MGLAHWLRKTFRRQKTTQEIVPFLDTENGRVIQIPASELRPGAVQVSLQPSGEVVWTIPSELRQSEVKHPEFDEDIRNLIRQIQEAFAEHDSLSIEEWEDGFRRDNHPEREIACWLHAAEIYIAFAENGPDAIRRRDVYVSIVTCMTTGPDAVWQVLRPQALSREEAERVVHRFFGKEIGLHAEPESSA